MSAVMGDIAGITIDPEFRDYLSALRPEEYKTLEASILESGCETPLTLWGDVLIDGHNRYSICTEHQIPYEVEQKAFSSRESVIDWMLVNQLGRRNLSPDDFRLFIGRLYNSRKKSKGGDYGNQHSEAKDQNDPLPTTAEVIAEEHGTSQATVKRAGKQAEAIDNATPELKEAVRNHEVPVSVAADVATLPEDEQSEIVAKGEKEILAAAKEIRKRNGSEKTAKLAEKKAENAEMSKRSVEDNRPTANNSDALDWLAAIEPFSVDLLITDPPYSTDVDDIEQFAGDWLAQAIPTLKQTGRAYICIGAYPNELLAYIKQLNEKLFDGWVIDNPLIWTYRNALGVTPKMKYNLNYQVILHCYNEDHSRELDTSITNEMFSVQDINAPDGRQGDRFHTWQKPDELADRLIRHSSIAGDVVIDPFCCTGTFLLAAARQGCLAAGCDISSENLEVAAQRGCNVA